MLLFVFSTASLFAQSVEDVGGNFSIYKSIDKKTKENPEGENSASIGLKFDFWKRTTLTEVVWEKVLEADLKLVSFRDISFRKEDQAYFQKLAEVKEVSFIRCKGLGSIIPALPQMPKLEKLSFFECDYLQNEESFSKLTGLKYLKLSQGWDLKDLPIMDHVETLDLKRATVYDEDLALIAEKFPKLRRLSLANTFVNGQSLDELSALPIEELWLNCTPLFQPNLANLSGFKSLKTLVLNEYMEGRQYEVKLDSILLVAKLESLRNLFLEVPQEETENKKEMEVAIEAAKALNPELSIHNIWNSEPEDF